MSPAPASRRSDAARGAAPLGPGAAPLQDAAPPDPGVLVALLADQARLRVVAALALGATTLRSVADAAELAEADVARALQRLIRGGLVERLEGGSLHLAAEQFRAAARAAAAGRRRDDPTPEELGATPAQAVVLRNFLAGGRLTRLPASRAKRLVVLDFLASKFEPGMQYPEREVNAVLGVFHDDVAALRRYLVDDGFVSRERGVYWRSGGTVD